MCEGGIGDPFILSGEFSKGSYCDLRPMKGQSKVFCRQR